MGRLRSVTSWRLHRAASSSFSRTDGCNLFGWLSALKILSFFLFHKCRKRFASKVSLSLVRDGERAERLEEGKNRTEGKLTDPVMSIWGGLLLYYWLFAIRKKMWRKLDQDQPRWEEGREGEPSHLHLTGDHRKQARPHARWREIVAGRIRF